MNALALRYMARFPRVKNLQITHSARATKRFCARFALGGVPKVVHFGLQGAYTYYDGAPEEKRKSYRARASRITNGAGEYTYNIPGTANSFAYWLLWN